MLTFKQFLSEAKAPTKYKALDVIHDILGKDKEVDEKHREYNKENPDLYCVKKDPDGSYSPGTKLMDFHKDEPYWSPATIYHPNPGSRDAADVAIAAHEAYHAKMKAKSKGEMWRNEKFANKLATDWLKKHLDGMPLHVALEMITKSKIHYGHN